PRRRYCLCRCATPASNRRCHCRDLRRSSMGTAHGNRRLPEGGLRDDMPSLAPPEIRFVGNEVLITKRHLSLGRQEPAIPISPALGGSAWSFCSLLTSTLSESPGQRCTLSTARRPQHGGKTLPRRPRWIAQPYSNPASRLPGRWRPQPALQVNLDARCRHVSRPHCPNRR